MSAFPEPENPRGGGGDPFDVLLRQINDAAGTPSPDTPSANSADSALDAFLAGSRVTVLARTRGWVVVRLNGDDPNRVSYHRVRRWGVDEWDTWTVKDVLVYRRAIREHLDRNPVRPKPYIALRGDGRREEVESRDILDVLDAMVPSWVAGLDTTRAFDGLGMDEQIALGSLVDRYGSKPVQRGEGRSEKGRVFADGHGVEITESEARQRIADALARLKEDEDNFRDWTRKSEDQITDARRWYRDHQEDAHRAGDRDEVDRLRREGRDTVEKMQRDFRRMREDTSRELRERKAKLTSTQRKLGLF